MEYTKKREKILENIIKFLITNHIGCLKGAMIFDCNSVDKMNDLKLDIVEDEIHFGYKINISFKN